jgi:hypothetical protein
MSWNFSSLELEEAEGPQLTIQKHFVPHGSSRSAAPPTKKVNHEMAPERFSCRLRPKWRLEPSLPHIALERGTANPRKYVRK